MAGQHPGIKWANLSGVHGAGLGAERMEINVLEVVFVCRGTSAEDLTSKKEGKKERYYSLTFSLYSS